MATFKTWIGKLFGRTEPRKLGRYRVRDGNTATATAILYRMGAGFPGDVNRSHPASIEPCLIDATTPPTAYGQLVKIDATTQGATPSLVAADVTGSAPGAWGITARPFPVQQTTGGLNASIGGAVPPTSGVIDVLKTGYIMVFVNQLAGAPVKGTPVFVWTAATGGGHTQGGFEGVATGGSTTQLPNAFWNGGTDANGIGELILRD